MFVALEGCDGTGKSTLCAVLSERLSATQYATPPKKYLTFRERVDKDAPPKEHYNFYRDGIYDASNEIQVILAGGRNVVSDRYWLSTYTYHQVMGVEVSVDDFNSIVLPTLTVILSLNKDAQIGRMLRRGMSTGDRRMLAHQQELASAFYRNVLEFNVPFIIVDTQKFSPEDCARIVTGALNL